jgi:hypothetical protein
MGAGVKDGKGCWCGIGGCPGMKPASGTKPGCQWPMCGPMCGGNWPYMPACVGEKPPPACIPSPAHGVSFFLFHVKNQKRLEDQTTQSYKEPNF